VSWETSFVAMSAALGLDAADAQRAILAVRDPETPALLAALGHASKTRRAQALAGALAKIARDVAAADLEGGA
jgi:hypothetical protein